MANKEGKQPRKKVKTVKKPIKKAAKTLSKSALSKKAVKKTTANKASKNSATRKAQNKSTKPKSVAQRLTKKQETKKEMDSRGMALEHLFKRPEIEEVAHAKTKETRLPTHMSLRAVEKAQAIKTILSEPVAIQVGKIAYILSFAFIAIGGLYSAGHMLSENATPNTLSANTLSSLLSNDTNSTLSPTRTSPVTVPNVSFSLNSIVPSTLTGEERVTFSLKNGVRVEAFLRNSNTGMRFQLLAEEVSPANFELLIPSGLTAGSYTLHITAEGFDAKRFDFKAASFTVSRPTTNEDVENATATTTTQLVTTNEEIILPNSSTTTKNNNEFTLFMSSAVLESPQMLIMQAPSAITELTVYITKRDSYTKQLVGEAKKEFGTWRLFVDTSNIPNGQYEIIAEASIDDFLIQSKPQIIEVRKPTIINPRAESVSETSSESEDSEESVVEETTERPVREFSELSLAPEKSTDSESETIVTELLRDNKTDLEILLRNYSVAAQTEDLLGKRLATEAINKKQAALQEADLLATPAIKSELEDRLSSLQSRIDTFEELRRSRSDRKTAIDSDQDGVADVDEIALFRTDPNNPDTDGDGVVDGVEIMRGYNPRNAASETAVLYESPRTTTGLIQAEALRIDKVMPAISVDTESEKKNVYALIEGKALPNSYVTLYMFSMPTIVTIKTDDTGAFSYTFAKELEDGTHEVYIAITDNSGEIVAQSQGFVFTKEAEAFTVGAVSTDQTPAEVARPETPYALGLGLGVLALGIILLMLGIGLRRPTLPITQ